jgi:hypothetical protein
VTDAETELRQGFHQALHGRQPQEGSPTTPARTAFTYTPPRLAFGGHTVQVIAEDVAGNVTTYSWGFKVVR